MFKKDHHDPVDHPRHYNNSDAVCSKCSTQIECIDIARHWNFDLGNVLKYLWRYKEKDGLIALKKAQWYLNDFITSEESKLEGRK
jgi:hypothetical protein